MSFTSAPFSTGNICEEYNHRERWSVLRTHLSFYCLCDLPLYGPLFICKTNIPKMPFLQQNSFSSLIAFILLDSHARSSKYFMTALGGLSTQGQNPQIPISNYTHTHTHTEAVTTKIRVRKDLMSKFLLQARISYIYVSCTESDVSG